MQHVAHANAFDFKHITTENEDLLKLFYMKQSFIVRCQAAQRGNIARGASTASPYCKICMKNHLFTLRWI